MLKKLNSWKDKLIDILSVSYKTSRRFMASFSVRMFSALSLVCLTLLFTLMLNKDQISFVSNATPNRALLETYNSDSDFLYADTLDNGEYKFYFKNEVRDNNGTKIDDIYVIHQIAATANAYNYSDGLVIYDGIFDNTSTNLLQPSGCNADGTAGDNTNVLKIVASRNKAYLKGKIRNTFKFGYLETFIGTNFDTSGLTDMSGMFYECFKLKYCDISNFDTSGVDNMSQMFQSCRELTNIDISNFDTSKVTDMCYMFNGCEKLESLDFSNWDTSKVTLLNGFLYDCKALKNIDVSMFDTSNVVNFQSIFGNCESLEYLNASNFVTTKATNVRYAFGGLLKLKYLDISSWDLSHVDTTNANNYKTVFGSSTNLTSKLCVLKTPKVVPASLNNLIGIPTMKDSSGISYQKLPVTNTSINLYKDQTNVILYSDDENIYYSNGSTTDLDGNSTSIFRVEKINLNNDASCSAFCHEFSNGVVILEGTGPVNGSLESKCNNSIKKIVASYEGYKPTGSLNSFFSYLYELEEFERTRMDFSSVTSMNDLFNTSFDAEKNVHLDFSHLDLSSCTSMERMFQDIKAVSIDISNWKLSTSSVNMCQLFYIYMGPSYINDIDMSNWTNGSSVSDFSYFFGGLKALKKINFRNTDLGNASTDFNYFMYVDGYSSVNPTEVKEIILPKSVGKTNIDLSHITTGLLPYDISGNKLSDSEVTTLIKENNTSNEYKLIGDKILISSFYDGENSFEYTNLYGKKMTGYFGAVSETYTCTVYPLNNEGNINAYYYSNGVLIFHGAGAIEAHTGPFQYAIDHGSDITEIFIGDPYFSPMGSIDYLFAGLTNPNGIIFDDSNLDHHAHNFYNFDLDHVTSMKYLCSGSMIQSMYLQDLPTHGIDASHLYDDATIKGTIRLDYFHLSRITNAETMFNNTHALSTARIILPQDIGSFDNAINLPNLSSLGNKKWCACYTSSNNYVLIPNAFLDKLIKKKTISGKTAVAAQIVECPLYTGTKLDTNGEPNSALGTIEYYSDRTNDSSVTLKASYDLSDTSKGEAPGSICAYIYTDGTMIFNGTGKVKGYNFNNASLPWREDHNISLVKRIVMGSDGFKPEGSMAYYFSPKDLTAYMVTDSNGNTHDGLSDDHDCCQIRSIDLTGIDTSKVTSFHALFYNCSTLNKPITGLESLNTSSVTDMSSMFEYICVRRSSGYFVGFDTDGVTPLYDSSLGHNVDFLEFDLSGWNVSKVRNFDKMFFYGFIKSVNLSGWTLDAAAPDHSITFSEFVDSLHAASGFNVSGWSNTKKINYSKMFEQLYNAKTIDLSSFEFDYDCTNMFGTDDMNINTIILPNKDNITNNAQVYLYNKYGSYNHRTVWVACNQNGDRVEGLNPIRCKDYMITKYDADGDGSYTGPNDIYQLKKVEDKLYQGKMLDVDGNPDNTLGDITYYRNGTSNASVTLATYDNDDDPNTPEVSCVWDISTDHNGTINAYLYTDGMMIFDGEGAINTYYDTTLSTYTPKIPWANTNNEVRKRVKRVVGSINKFKPIGSLSFYFCQMDNLNTFDGTNFVTSDVNYLSNTFSYSGIKKCIMKNWNTNKVISVFSMFSNSNKLTELDMTGCTFNSLTSASFMFYNSSSISSIDLSSWNTTLTDITYMFDGTSSLTDLDLGDNITINTSDISKVFCNTGLSEPLFKDFKESLKPISNLEGACGINFGNDTKYSTIDLSKLDLSGVASPTSTDDAKTKYFYTTKAYVDSQKDTSKIKTIILPSKVPNIAGGGCELYIPHIDGYVWNGYASDGTTRASDGGVTYKSLPAMNSSSNLSMIKLDKEILHTDSDGIIYYRDGTSDASASPITRVKVYDLTNTSGTRGDSANTVRAYLYSNGLLILDGEGDINTYTNREDVPWRKDLNLHTITKVVGSNNRFIPHGSMAYYFDMACDTTYYANNSGNVNVSDDRVIDNFTCIDFTNIDTSNVTSFKNLLHCCDILNQAIGVENLITDNVTDMSDMFSYTESLGGLDLSTHTDNSDPLHPITYWNVSSVTKFDGMFRGALKYDTGTSLTLNNWTLSTDSNGISAVNMFNYSNLRILNTNGWTNTNNLKNVSRMFFNNSIGTLDLSGFSFTRSDITGDSDMIGSIFYTNKIILPDNIKTGFNISISARTHESWLGYNGDTKISDDPYYTVVKKGSVTGLDNIRRVQDILHTDSNGVNYYRDGTSDVTISLDTYDHDGDASTAEIQCIWDLSKNNDNSVRAYLYTDGLLILDGSGEITEYTYYTYNNIPWRVYQKEHLISKVVGSNRGFKPIGSMAYLFFMNKYTDGTGYLDNESLNTVDFTNIDTSEVTSFEYLFYYCKHLSNIIGLSNLDTHNVTSMQAMFNVCQSLTSLDLHHDSSNTNVWDVSNVTKFASMFSNLGSNTNNVNINLSGWTLNSSNDISAYYMFQFSHIDNINLTGTTFTNKLKDIESMFWYTCLVNPLDLSKFDLTNPSLTYDNDTLKIDLNNLSTYTNTIILPESDKLLAGANLQLPTKTDYAWFGYDSSGNRLSEKTYTTLPKQGDDPNLYQIKLEGSALFTIDGKKYYATDLLYKWDVSEIGDEGSIFAYAFKDNAGNVTVVFNDESTDSNYHYMMTFNNYEGYPTHDANLDTYTMDEYFDRKLYRNSISFTPWSILNKYASTKSLNGVTEFKFNTPIHFKDTKYLFAGTNVSEIEIDDNYLFELSDSTNHYDHIGMFSGLNDPFSIKFTSDIPYLSCSFATAMDSESRLNTIDFSGITITNYPEQYVPIYDQYLLVDNSFGIIYLPEHLIGFDNDLYKERIEFIDVIASDNNSCKWFEVYNDNDSIDTSDDIFLGYTDTLIDTNCTLYKDNSGNTIYPSYIKHLSVEDEFALNYIDLYNQYIEGKYLFGQDRIDELTKSSPDLSLILDIVFSTLQLEEYYSDTALGPMLGLVTSLEKLFDDSSFNGLFKSSDLRTEFKNYYYLCVSGSLDNVDLNIESLVNDLFEFIKDDREDLGLSPKISYSSYENKFTYDNDTNELGYFKKVANEFISELFNKELISDNSLTISSYGDTIKLYVSNILGDVYKLFINFNDEKDASDNLVFNENYTTPVYDDTNERYVYEFDLLDVGKFTFKALNKYFTAFNVSPTMKDDGLGNETDNEYTVTVNTNKIDLSSSNTNVTVSNVAPQLLADPPVQIEPDITVTYTNNVGVPIVLEEDTDYTVTYGANNSSGTNAGTITITGNNTNTSGTRTIYFDINDSFIKLKLSDLQLGTYGSLDENEIVKYKDGTNNRNPEDITTFGASELHPFIIYNDGTSDIPIYLEYTNAFISDASGNPIFTAGENERSISKTKRNIKFEGLKLSDSDSAVYKLFEDNLTTEISSSNSNDNLVYLNASYLLDKTNPTVSAISKDASVTSPLSYNDELILNVIFSEELKSPIDKNDITLTYQIGNLIDDTNFKLTIKDDTDIVYSDSNHKTIIKFTGTIPSDIGLIIDSPIKIKSLLTDDYLYDIAGNELDRDVVNKFTDNILVNTLEDYSKNLLDDIDIFDPDVTNSDIEKAMIAYEKLSPSDKDAINGSNYVNVLNKKYYGDDSDRTTYPGLVVPGEKDVTNIDGNDNESVEVFGTVRALEDKYSYKIILRVDKITDSNEIKNIETKLKNKVSLYKQDEANLSSYRIKLVDSNTGNEVEPDLTDKILVRLEVPYEVFSKINALYHILDDDSVETLLPLEKGKYNVFDGINYVDKYYIYFETNSFSSFTLTMLTGIIPAPDPAPTPDPKPISTQTITVQTIKNNSYIDGYKDGTFKPEDNITRGEFSKILASISNNYSDSNKLDYSRYINSYKDVSTNDWYSSYIGFNNKKQVMVGYNDMTFKPNKAITRAEAAKALTNMYNITANNNSSNTNTFNRELNGKWYENSMKKLINAGLLKGYPDGTIRPNDPITRAEIVALINRVTNRDMTNNFIKNDNIKVSDVSKDKWYYNDIVSAMLDY